MSLRNCCTVAGISMLLAALPLRADQAADHPFYGGFALGFASADSNCDYYGYNCDGTDTTFKIYAGKQVHRNLAVELAFHDLGKIRNEGFSESTTAETQGINLSLLGIIPVSEFGFFYGKAGYMAWNADYTRNSGSDSSSRSDEDGSDFTYGAGFAFTFSPDYDFRIEFERLNDLGDDFVPGGAPIEVLYFAGSIKFY